MTPASCSSTCFPRRHVCEISEMFHKERIQLGSKVSDMFAAGAPRTQLLFHRKTSQGLSFEKEHRFGHSWIDHACSRKLDCKGWSLQKHHIPFIKAVANVAPNCLVPSEDDHKCNSNLLFGSDSYSQGYQSSNDDSSEQDDREKLRRMRISRSNIGRVPWNKGRKHSAETIQRIRERTRIAMQDPKVKMKLLNLGHAQSEETRMKIGMGVRKGWYRRRKRLLVQEKCLLKWQNLIAEASRKGYAGEKELHWQSYEFLDEQLKEEWLESIEKRKTMHRPKGSKRAPKSSEQRRKISEAISAKWADPAYRERVCTALAKYHDTRIGVESKPRRKPICEVPVRRESMKKRATQPEGINSKANVIRKATSRKPRNATPSYKDPMARSKLGVIKKIREQREAMEARKREATDRAKLLIAKAEEAAKALEVAALKSPLAQASLLESRKLIAEAKWYVESTENGKFSQLNSRGNASFSFCEPAKHVQTSLGALNSDSVLDKRLVNGSHTLSVNKTNCIENTIDKLRQQNGMKSRETLSAVDTVENFTEIGRDDISINLQQNNVRGQSRTADPQEGQSVVNDSIGHSHLQYRENKDKTLQMERGDSSITSATKGKKRWVRGRLVEVQED
ncbi:uncharacterized protein [Elaeis guineensis]|uniref:Uncharacterized protein LOC105054976 n=1 Tax=Elaeis guineensis var. tenera TaxID=51953 RepID=A0A6I9S050_ELAGV|nr:uncharacterized protein LOC105054976 [Elaeis guineensis]